MFDPGRLRLLEHLSRLGTMSAVAEALGYSPSAVSQQLALLQREAGVRLLERTGRRVHLTPEGERLAGHARLVLATLDAAQADLRQGDTPRGPVRVATFATAGSALVLPAAREAQRRHPQLQVFVHQLEPPQAVRALHEHGCDLAVVYEYSLVPRRPGAQTHRRRLAREPVLLAVPEGHPVLARPAAYDGSAPGGDDDGAPGRRTPDRRPVDLAELADESWIAGGPGSPDFELITRACALAGYQPRVAHTSDDYRLVADMIVAGLGVALLPRLAAPYLRPEVVLLPVGTVPLHRDVRALTRPVPSSPAVQAMLTLLEHHAAGVRMHGPAVRG